MYFICYTICSEVFVMLFIYYPKCSTCQKAKKFLEENKTSFEERDIKLQNPNYEEQRG